MKKKEIIENDQDEVRTKNSVKHLLEISEQNGTWVDIEITPYQNRIIIPKIGKNIPLVDIKNRALDNSNELNNIFMFCEPNKIIPEVTSSKYNFIRSNQI